MPRIQLQSEESQDPIVKAIFDEIKSKAGQVPAPYRAFARLPHILQANWNKTKAVLTQGNLPVSLKESIALAVSTANGCRFCIAIHRKNLEKQGFSKESIKGIAQARSEDPKNEAVLKFAVQATKDPHGLTDGDFKKLKSLGYSEEDILEILTTMEMYTGYNRIITALGISPED